VPTFFLLSKMAESFEIILESNINNEEAEDRLFRALSMVLPNDNGYDELLRKHLLNKGL
jgi:hypothetical protein